MVASRSHGGYSDWSIDLYELGGEDLVVRGRPSIGQTIAFELHAPVGAIAFLLSAPDLAPDPIVLAGVGIYGLMSSMVNERTHEIGIRMALGAAGGDVLGLVVRQTVRLVVIGAVLGLAGAIALGRALTSLVFEVRPSDPATLTVVTVLLMLVALAATLVPAMRATRVTPLVALRRE